ncbi:interferon-induced GTP-binding protein Mx [Decorospora gaudefroyi]|uniref:Interferon-induced GTP-binding protein Mx n=1 Tax=Decorospora gaudefroyi TaxID=184978 RepID=A0A6A5K3X9_9PLEO|nr:interferon-induced GTP-binding protein Mx [Decorospora gaudefroyi]
MPQSSEQSTSQQDASRLSEGLEPMHLSDKDVPLRQSKAPVAGEIEPLGLHVKEAIATINRLEGLGLQRLKIPLPKCIVLGEQSTGKSSVIEAISGIKTPRSTDTCTRCPLFIKLEPSENTRASWNARITLRRDFVYDGKSGRGHERRFPRWAQISEPSTVMFAETDNPDELEELIRRAQMATISPLVDYKEFLLPSLATLDNQQRCEFSPNIVCIAITHPRLPALSFYDLPGIIGQAESAESQFLVKFVRDLVIDYVKDEESLILVTWSLESDIANSTAGGIARDLKATNRCIGVLTEPDRLPPGSRNEKLSEVFDQKRFALGHGYFVVKNLGQDEIDQGMTHQQARAQEQQFFSQEEPWATTFEKYQLRFGTLNLQSFLSGKLAEQITKKLPTIDREINIRLQQVEAELQQFPEPPTHNASRIIYDVLLDFSQHVRKEIEAEFPCKIWRNNWEALQKAFFDALASMKPTMKTNGRRDARIYFRTLGSKTGTSAKEAIPLDDDEEEDDDDAEDGDTSMSNNPETPKKKRKFDETLGPSPVTTPLNHRRSQNPVETDARAIFPDFSNLREHFDLDKVTQYLAENSQSKIPGQVEPRVVDNMMLNTLKHWAQPLEQFFNTLEKQLRDQVKVAFEETFKKWQGSALYHNTWTIVEEMLTLNFHQQRTTMADESLNDEKEGPYIFHDEIFQHEKETMLEHYHEHRCIARMKTYKKEKLQHAGKATSASDEEKLKRDPRIMAELEREPYEVEIGVVAQVTTYYMLAARRFHDAVCMRIESKFYKQLRTQLRDELENGLGLKDDKEGYRNAIALLAEPPHRYSQRKDLVGQRNSLMQGQKILRDLQSKKYGGAGLSQRPNGGTGTRYAGSSFVGMPTPLPENMENAHPDGLPRR